MRAQLWTLIAVALFACHAQSASAQSSLAPVDGGYDPFSFTAPSWTGNWKVTEFGAHGNVQPAATVEAARITLRVTGDTCVLATNGNEHSARLVLDSAGPATFDFVNPSGVVEKGIYQLEGDTLTICFADPGYPRPTGFVTSAAERTYLVTCHRDAITQTTGYRGAKYGY